MRDIEKEQSQMESQSCKKKWKRKKIITIWTNINEVYFYKTVIIISMRDKNMNTRQQ